MTHNEERQSERMEDLTTSPDLEEHYAEIGRSVVANATAQVRDQMSRMENPTADDLNKVVVAVPVWVTAQPGQGERRKVGDVCCVCTVSYDGVIICRGTCCIFP